MCRFVTPPTAPFPLVCDRSDEAIAIAARLRLKPVEAHDGIAFHLHRGRVCLHSSPMSPQRGICFDWPREWHHHRRHTYAIRKEPLARAVGIRGHHPRTVWDVTCGTGKDSLLLLAFGATVVAFERHPAVITLLEDALFHGAHTPGLGTVLADRFTLHRHSVADTAPRGCCPPPPDAIYLDPMFPRKKGSALPRKEMVLFQEIVGMDDDSDGLLALCRRLCNRVVVKRPLKSPPLAPDVTHAFSGRTTRYDMYMHLSQDIAAPQ